MDGADSLYEGAHMEAGLAATLFRFLCSLFFFRAAVLKLNSHLST
jgi:hypothetical protein